jgi:hypothetical protein
MHVFKKTIISKPSLFVWLISHQPTILFSQSKPATSQQYFSLRINQHQPSATSQTNRLKPLASPCVKAHRFAGSSALHLIPYVLSEKQPFSYANVVA